MTVRLTSDGKALVDTKLKYIKIDPSNPPQGKVILINSFLRQPVVSVYHSGYNWTHYFPLPTLPEDENAEETRPYRTQVRKT